MRKPLLVCLIFLITFLPSVQAQTPRTDKDKWVGTTCNCPTPNESGFIDEPYAKMVVDSLAGIVGERIDKVLSVKCTSSAQALLCFNEKYILYNNELLEGIKNRGARWAEKFIMAHEIAHHSHKHTSKQNIFSDDRMPQILIKQDGDDGKIYGLKIKTKRNGNEIIHDTLPTHRKSLINALNFYQHLREFQADASATWILYKLGIGQSDLDNIWKQYAIQTNSDPRQWSAFHPSIEVRKAHTDLLLTHLLEENSQKGQRSADSKVLKKVNQKLSYESVGTFITTNRNTFGSDSSGRLSLEEQRFWDYLNRKGRFVIEPDFGVLIKSKKWEPTLSGEASLPAKLTGINAFAGIKITRLSWYRHLWTQLSVGYKELGFSTYEKQNNLEVGIERFKWQGLYISPQVLLTNVSGKFNYDYLKQGVYIAAGVTTDIPIRLLYQNFLAGTLAEELATRIGVSPNVEVGLIQLSRDPRKINARLGVTFQPQKITINQGQNFKIHYPQVGVRLSARIW